LGLTTAFAILTRGNVLLLVPGVLGLLCWRQRRNWRRVAIYTVLFVVAMYVPQLPFSLRNLSYHGRWTGPSSAQDAVLALGNTSEAPPGGLEYPPSYHEAVRKANLPDGHAVPVTRQMLHWAWRQPMAFCELKWRTLLLFWSHTEIPNNVNMAGEGRRSVLLRFPAVVPFWLFGSLAIAGMLLLWRRRSPDRLFVYYVTIVYCLSTVLFYMLARFRIPLVPLLCVLAGGGAIQLWGRIRKARSGGEAARKRLLFSVLALAAGLYVTLKAFETYQTLFEASAMRLCRPSGVVLETPEHIAVFDHGAASMGGLTPLPVPNRGVTVQKTLIIPNSVSSAKRVTSATLRIPILMEKGSSIQVDLVGLERTASPDSDAFEDGPGYVWLNIPVAPPKSGGELTFSFTIRPTRGRISLVIDRFRDYGRTQFSGSHGEMVSIGAESAVEFRWNTE
ncbi:MAG: hypothetical protein KAI66_02105, partial [Lentisphaeria bacterium]|nr:hypothetical protein [Lentisphaeria bacterium]